MVDTTHYGVMARWLYCHFCKAGRGETCKNLFTGFEKPLPHSSRETTFDMGYLIQEEPY